MSALTADFDRDEIVFERLPPGDPEIGVHRSGQLSDWVAYRKNSFDWAPRGYGINADAAWQNLIDREIDFYDDL